MYKPFKTKTTSLLVKPFRKIRTQKLEPREEEFRQFTEFTDTLNKINVIDELEKLENLNEQPMTQEQITEDTDINKINHIIEPIVKSPEEISMVEYAYESKTGDDSESKSEDNLETELVTKLENEAVNDLVRKNNLFKDIFNISLTSISKVLKIFTSVPPPETIVVLFITKHGGYIVNSTKNDRLDISTIPCPVKNLIRYQLAPHGTCSWGTVKSDYNNFNIFHKILSEGELTENIVLNKLKRIPEILIKTPDITTDFFKQQNITKKIGEEKITKKIHLSNQINSINYGDLLLNKVYQLDNSNKKISGILIMFTVTFLLPDIFFENYSNMTRLNDVINSSPNYVYKIGIYNDDNKTITYNANTELTSCPYFQLYTELWDGVKPKLLDAVSLDNAGINTQTLMDTHEQPLIRPMIYEIESDILYTYFQYVNTLVNIDLSCGSFMYPENVIKTEAIINNFNKLQRFFGTIQRRYVKKGIRGGKRKTLKKHKKHTYKYKRYIKNKRYTKKY